MIDRKTGRNSMARRMLVARLLLGVSLTAVLATPTKAEDFVIGVINALTGDGSELGLGSQQAVEPFADEINKAGGIDGMQLKIVLRDDESNPQKAVAAVYELLQRQRASIIMGTNLTNVAFAVTPIINQAKVPFIVFGTGTPLIDPVKFPYSFRTSVNTGVEAGKLVDYAFATGRYKKPGIMVDATALGQTGDKALRAALAKYNLEPVAAETFNPGDTDMTSQLSRLQKAGADVMFVWGVAGPMSYVARSADRIGYHPDVLCNLGVHSQVFIDLTGEAGKSWAGTAYRATTFAPNDPVPADVKAYIGKMRQLWGSKATSGTVLLSVQWQDTLSLVVQAIKRAKSKNGDDLKKALEETSYKGMMSNFSFGPDKHDGIDPAAVTISYATKVDDVFSMRVPDAP
jgi:branched-chain amino acid transport system substrate-binding protein